MARCRSLSQPYDPALTKILVAYIVTGLAFMLLPGTLIGVLSLLKISSAQAPGGASLAWIQGHGHAQIFGWLGTFILGIGYYTIPRLRSSAFSPRAAWLTWSLWTAGVTMRWAVGSWPWNWRILFPLSALLELAGVAIFAWFVYAIRPQVRDDSWRKSVVMITAAGVAMVLALAVNAAATLLVAIDGSAPVIEEQLNQRLLVLSMWGFIVPFIWGFSSRWLPPLLGLRRTRKPLMVPSLALLGAGVAASLAGSAVVAAALILIASVTFAFALRVLEPSEKEPKLQGVHPSTPSYVRLAYAWCITAAVLGVIAARHAPQNGYAGASRHALTVGFFTAIVFTVGPRILPGLLHVKRLWSRRVMAATLALINIGCTLRVVSQIAAFENVSQHAWAGLRLSAIVELVGVVLFALNLVLTLKTGRSVRVLAPAPVMTEEA